MKHLIKAIEQEKKASLENFITSINEVQDIAILVAKYGYYSDLIPKGKNVNKMLLPELKAYLIGRKEKATYKEIECKVSRINAVANAGELISVKISVEWKRSAMWGSNPKAECWAQFKDANGNFDSCYVVSGSIGGCGYDKLSTAVADVLNQVNAVLRPFYLAKNEAPTKKNHEFLGYGSGYGILPSFEGGVGISCYPRIFDSVGYDFKTVASGKTYDVFTISKKYL